MRHYKTESTAFQSTPSAWRETRNQHKKLQKSGNFNPLPPHGGRHHYAALVFVSADISIHSLRMEGDMCNGYDIPMSYQNFNPLPPHGGRRQAAEKRGARKAISIHSLRMEGDSRRARYRTAPSGFQSTPSAWRETAQWEEWNNQLPHFNPLPPHGGRRH